MRDFASVAPEMILRVSAGAVLRERNVLPFLLMSSLLPMPLFTLAAQVLS